MTHKDSAWSLPNKPPFPLVAWEQCTLHALNGIQVTFSLLLEQVLLEIKVTVSEEQVWHLVHSTKNKSLTSSHTCQTCSKEISLGNITNTHFFLISKEELTYFFFVQLKYFLWEDQFAKTIVYVWNNPNHKTKLHMNKTAYEKASGLLFALEVIHTNTTIYSAAAPSGPSHAQDTHLVHTIKTWNLIVSPLQCSHHTADLWKLVL